jgi:hypothetical protein
MPGGRADRYDLEDDDDDRRRPAKRSGDRPWPRGSAPRRRRDVEDDPRPPNTRTQAKPKVPPVVWLIVVVVPLIGFVVFMAIRQSRNRAAEQGAFAAEMDKFVSTPAPGPVKATPGKVAIVDVDKRELHYLHESNGGEWSDLQAATPQEATIIVQVRVMDRPVREYINGRKGVKQAFHLTVIDKASWTKIDERTFEGGDPPESIRIKGGGGTNEPVAGEMPTKEIRDYLRGLARG